VEYKEVGHIEVECRTVVIKGSEVQRVGVVGKKNNVWCCTAQWGDYR
jgi:hypothetical protein